MKFNNLLKIFRAICIEKQMRTEVIFSNNFDLSFYNNMIENSVCVVIDALIAVSTMTTILDSNYKRIVFVRKRKLTI